MSDKKTSQSVRVPPHDSTAEKSVLGAMLIDASAITAVAEVLQPKHFYFNEHQNIYSAILGLFDKSKPIDIVTLTAQLQEDGTLQNIGGTAYLAELIEAVPTSAYVKHYAEIVKNMYIKRSLITVGSNLVGESFDQTGDVHDILNKAETDIFALSQAFLHRDFVELKEILAESFERLENFMKSGSSVRGVPTGFSGLDKKLSGLQDSNLVILAARPGVGKTTLALNIALHVALHEKMPIGMFSLEMSKEELVDRLLVGQADIDAWKLKTGRLSDDDYMRLTQAMGDLASAPIFIDDTPGASILEMRTKARKLTIEKGLKMIIVDYLQLATPGRRMESRVQEVSMISQSLKNIARELKIPVLALSQLSRAIEHRGEKKPQLADLRESGCLAGDTLIPLANTGQQVPIKDLAGKSDIWIWTLNEKYKIVPQKALKIFSSGEKQLYQLKFKSGRTIKASANHKFMKADQWVRLDEMKIGEKFALPLYYPEFISDSSQYSDDMLIFLAHMIGDGCYVSSQPVHYTSADKKNIDMVQYTARNLFGILGRVVKQKNWYHVYLPNPQHSTRGRYHPFRAWLQKNGLKLAHSYEKRLPGSLFNCSSRQISLFLKHLWATDGCIHLKKRKISLYYSTTSPELAFQVQYLLLRIGIQSTLRPVKQKKGSKQYRVNYHVDIQGKTNQLVFLEKVGCFGRRGDIISQCTSILKTVRENPNVGTLSKEIWRTLITQAKEETALSWRQFASALQMSYCGSSLFESGISVQRLERIADITFSEKLYKLARADIYWDELISVEKLGIEDVYDITVPQTHNFIANDIVVHNSIEQDADVVMFIYTQEDSDELLDDSKKMVKLFIAKHRNGPTGEVDLMFRGDRVRFYSVEKE